MEDLELTILGDPVPKARARVTKAGITYTPAKTRKWEQTAALMAQAQMRGRDPLQGPLEVVVIAEWPVPVSWPAWKRDSALQGRICHTTKPDADNIIKAAVDALNGIVFRDDSQIVGMIARKGYSERPAVTIRVRALDAMPAQAKRKPEARHEPQEAAA